MRLSLVDGAIPATLIVLAAGSGLAAIWMRRARYRWLLRLAGIVMVTCSVTGFGVRWLFDRFGLVEYRWPNSFYAWFAGLLFVTVNAVAGFRAAAGRTRVVLTASVAASGLLFVALINMQYAYYPTIASIVGYTAAHEVTLTRLASMRSQPIPTHGVVVPVTLPAATAMFAPRLAHVYLPPAWFLRQRPRLPVVLLLAGTPGQTTDWTRAGDADRTADSYAAAHGGIAPILVMADGNGSFWGDSECVDRPGLEADTYLSRDVPTAIRQLFDVSSTGWAVAGSSEGGTCALLLALHHPDIFPVVADYSGDLAPSLGRHDTTVDVLFAGSQDAWQANLPVTIMGAWTGPRLAVWFEAGSRDRNARSAARDLASAATTAGFDVRVNIRAGQHDFRFWAGSFAGSIEWITDRVQAVGRA